MGREVIFFKSIGALTSKPYAFVARPWELRSIESLDLFDAVGCPIRIDYRGQDVVRILPSVDSKFYDDWITDRIRFSYDAFKRQRILAPAIKYRGENRISVSWREVFRHIKDEFTFYEEKHGSKLHIQGICGDLVDLETMVVFKEFLNKFSSYSFSANSDIVGINGNLRHNYLFNSGYSGIDHADVCLLVGTNIRYEAPLLNLKIRKNVLMGRLKVGVIGFSTTINYPVINLGSNLKSLILFLEGRHSFCRIFSRAVKPMVIVGLNLLRRYDSSIISSLFLKLKGITALFLDNWNGYNVLHLNSNTLGVCELEGFSSMVANLENSQIFYLLDVDDVKVHSILNSISSKLIIYQGHHNDIIANTETVDVVLPGELPYERSGTYLNMEGHFLYKKFVLDKNYDSLIRSDWLILSLLSYHCFIVGIFYNCFSELSSRLEDLIPSNCYNLLSLVFSPVFGISGLIFNSIFINTLSNFYLSNSITRSSYIMSLSSARYKFLNFN